MVDQNENRPEASSAYSYYGGKGIADMVGKNLFIRTVTHHYAGRLLYVGSMFLRMDHASWIPDDGRFSKAVSEGKFDEIEMYPPEKVVAIGLGAILDICEIPVLPTHNLPE
jgi:hypothetical protein